MIRLYLTVAAHSTNKSLNVRLKLEGTVVIVCVIKIFRQFVPKSKSNFGNLQTILGRESFKV